MTDAGFVVCGRREFRCECVLPADDHEVHVCDEGCGGSWTYDAEGEFVVVTYPRGVPTGRPRPMSESERDALLTDPITRGVMGGAVIRATRGPIRYIQPPEQKP